ncbi:hypothetical protein ACCAA_420029 [Candidatus Accumulibacter aalborgensis]|uniref:Uncharacterized protein n=1 Tax=Candidatus Accumulibacter aalborgensis TaxID=1860102 RepID=A0A1A8XTQ0_9PROT|nr:hypothetical protein ACCAA_420029 [Candidatus Accumulibacter aalborgensis]
MATTLNNLAGLYKAQGGATDALTASRRSSAILAHRFGEGARSEGEGSVSEQRRFALYFEFNIALLAEASAREPKAAEALDAALERDFPRYRELTTPRPLTLAGAQKLLGPNEALLAFLFSGDEGYVWALRRDQARMARLGVSAKALSERIRKLRVQLDLSAANVEAQLACPFDVQAAHALYADLLGPVADLLTVANPASHLIVVPDKALTGLPETAQELRAVARMNLE